MSTLRRVVTASRLIISAVFRHRRQEWHASPAQELARLLAAYCHAREHEVRLRKMYFRLTEILKYREFAYLRKSVFRKRLSGGATQAMRLDVAAWPAQIGEEVPDRATTKLHGVFELDAGFERPLDLAATILSSDAYHNVSFVWTNRTPPFDPAVLAPFQDRSPEARAALSFDAARPIEPRARERLERDGDPTVIDGAQAEAHRRVNELLKLVAPKRVVVAVSLPEDELGFCDEALVEMHPLFETLHKAAPWATFCVLNPTTLDATSPQALERAGVVPVRSRGLDEAAAFALAVRADAYLGAQTEHALAAATAGRPGLYWGIAGLSADYHDSAKKQWFLHEATAETIESVFGDQLRSMAPIGAAAQDAPQPLPSTDLRATIPSNVRRPPAAALEDARRVAEQTAGWRERVKASSYFLPPAERPTVTLYIDIFGYCNLRCPSCPVGNWPKDEEKAYTAGLIEESTLRALIEKALAETNVSSVGLFNWTVPLLHPDVAHLVRVVRSYGLSCSISSNLNILKDPESLLASGLDWMRVSVSGWRQDIYSLNHVRGDIERVKENMRRLAEARDKVGAATDLELFFHKYKDNEADEEPMRAYAESLGFRFQAAWAYLMPVEKMLTLAKPEKPHVLLTPDDDALIDRLALPPDESLEIASKHKVNDCELYDFLTIDINGDLFICCASSGRASNKLGNYLEMSMADIREGQKTHSLCGPCMEVGLPILYGHKDTAFDDLGERERKAFARNSGRSARRKPADAAE